MVYLPSSALATELVKRRRGHLGPALLLGNPTQDLAEAEREVAWVAEHLAMRDLPVHTFVGAQATTACMAVHAPTAALLHFAGHTQLAREDFLRSGLELADRRLTVPDVMTTVDLRQAALVYLSSCDSAQAVPGHTEELLALARAFVYAGAPTVLATLWALDDAAGAHFADYFYQAWVGAGQPLAHAFQQAMQRLKARLRYAHPFYWAPFVLLGAWR